MSLYDYRISKEILKTDPPFYALIMTAMHKADTENLALLRSVFPDTYAELQERYNAPGAMTVEELQNCKFFNQYQSGKKASESDS